MNFPDIEPENTELIKGMVIFQGPDGKLKSKLIKGLTLAELKADATKKHGLQLDEFDLMLQTEQVGDKPLVNDGILRFGMDKYGYTNVKFKLIEKSEGKADNIDADTNHAQQKMFEETGTDEANIQKYTFQVTCDGFEESTVSGYTIEDFRLKILETFEELIHFEFEIFLVHEGK